MNTITVFVDEDLLIGCMIRRAREHKNIHRTILAEKLEISGSSLDRKEKGQEPFKKLEIDTALRFLEVNPNRFMIDHHTLINNIRHVGGLVRNKGTYPDFYNMPGVCLKIGSQDIDRFINRVRSEVKKTTS